MITRRFGFPRLHHVTPVRRDRMSGLIHVKIVDGQPHVWPVARPGGVYMPMHAPHYLHVTSKNRAPGNDLIRTNNTPELSMTKPRVEMDPSDNRTWQRPY